MSAPVTFHVTFDASVKPEYANFGINGYKIGEKSFRSIASLDAGLKTAFAKDLGEGRYLTATVEYQGHVALITAETITAALDAITDELENFTPITLDELLES